MEQEKITYMIWQEIYGNGLGETCTYTDTALRYVIRGCSFTDPSSSVCYRANYIANYTYTNLGFRPALYIK